MTFLEFWNAQSDTVKGAVLGATVAMIGVIVNGIISGWNTSRQLKHDRDERTRERALTLRRDIYLGVAEHINNSVLVLSHLADLTYTIKDAAKKALESAHFPAKLHLMAKPPLIESVSNLTKATTGAILRIRIKRQKVERAHAEIATLRKRAESHREAAGLILAQLGKHELEAPLAAIEMQRLTDIYQREKIAGDALAEEHDQKYFPCLTMAADLFHESLEEQQALWPLFIKAAAAAREELGEPIDMSVYQRAHGGQMPLTREDILGLFGASQTQMADVVLAGNRKVPSTPDTAPR